MPTVTGTTNPSIGNGVPTGRYLRLGKTIICTIVMQMGSTTTYGSGHVDDHPAGGVGVGVANQCVDGVRSPV